MLNIRAMARAKQEKVMRNIIYRNPRHRSRQQGAITMFSAVLILVLLTEMVLYAVQVGVFETRKSSNEIKQKLAFHTADSAIQVAKQFLSANATLASSAIVDKRADGTDGWLAAGAERWQPCSAIAGTEGIHPCFGEPVAALRANTYYYSFDDPLTDNDIDLPLDLDALSASTAERVRMHALLCMLDFDDSDENPTPTGCTLTPADDPRNPKPGEQDFRYFLITLLARGEADCEGTNCGAEALIAEKIGSFGPGGNNGGPGAPLTARTNVPLSGTVEVVPNPNGGGTGVPISSWVNARTGSPNLPGNSCVLDVEPISPISGSYATCEAQEWYGVDIRPEDYKCPGNTPCSCDKTKERLLTYAKGADRQMGIDIVPDPNFPCDLWEYSFGLTWQEVRELASEIPGHLLTDCSDLDENSDGLYWISGGSCALKDQIGGKDNPVLLISAAANTSVSAGAELFGVLFVTNKEVPAAKFTGNGTATIYGAAIMDAEMKNFNGTFQIVYVDNLADQVWDTPLFGAVAGGWTDFHRDWR
jgi:hypothetical protein